MNIFDVLDFVFNGIDRQLRGAEDFRRKLLAL